MSIEVKCPVLPESVSDATVATWHKQEGDRVSRDENLVDLETDKVMLEVPSPADGVLKEIKCSSGETVESDDVLGVIEESEEEDIGAAESAGEDEGSGEGEDTGKGEEEEEGDKEKEETDEKDGKEDEKGRQKEEDERKERGAEKEEAESKGAGKPSPAARRLAEEEGVDTGEIQASGRGGRLTKQDVVRFLKQGGAARPEERVKMTRLRKRIAERMKEAQDTAAILTSFNEVDLKAVLDLRRKYKDDFQQQHGVKLGLMSFFVRACCEALRKHPVVNASLEGEEIVYHGYQDIGIAVSTERGLMVPIVRNAGQMTLAEIETTIREYAEKARDGKIELEDLQGGTFSITNGGVFGSLLSTPLLNPPQSAILGMHAIKERPMVVEGEIVARPMMYTALSYDHRIIDGKDAVQFLVAVKDALEDPARMLLNL